MKLARAAKTICLVLTAIILIAAVASFTLWTGIRGAGTSNIEQWIGRYLISVVEGYIHPKLAWRSLDYQAPLTVIIDAPVLTDDGVTILAMDRLTLTLDEIPREGQPVRIQRLEFDKPSMRFVAASDGGLRGWTHFLRQGAATNAPSVQPAGRMSDMLRMRYLEINDGRVEYQPDATSAVAAADDDANRMILRGIDLRLETPPDPNDLGWYIVAGKLSRERLLDLSVDGRLNVDTGLLEFTDVSLTATLDEQRYDIFPPWIQEFLRRHEIRGAISLALQGTVPVSDISAADVRAQAEFGGSFLWHGSRVSIDTMALSASFAQGNLDAGYKADLLGGRSTGRLATTRPADSGGQSRSAADSSPDSASAGGNGGAVRARAPQLFASINVDNLDAQQVVALIPSIGESLSGLRGRLSADIHGDIPATGVDLGVWRIDAVLRDAIIAWKEFSLSTPTAGITAELTGDILSANYRIALPRGHAVGAISTTMGRPEPLRASLNLDGARAEDIVALLPFRLRDNFKNYCGEFTAAVDATIPLHAPELLHCIAELHFADAIIGWADHVSVETPQADAGVTFDAGALAVDIRAAFKRGRANGHVFTTIGTADAVVLSFDVNETTAETMAPVLPRRIRESLVDTRGVLSGKVSAELPARDQGDGVWRIDAELLDGTLAWQSFRVDTPRADVRIDIDGDRITVTPQVSLPPGRAAGVIAVADERVKLSMDLDQTPAGAILAILPQTRPFAASQGSVTARLEANFPGSRPADGEWSIRGQFRDAILAFDASRLATPQADIDARLSDGRLNLGFQIELAQGRLIGDARTTFPDGPQTAGRNADALRFDSPVDFDITLQNAAASDILALIPAAARPPSDRISGRVSGNLSGEFSPARWQEGSARGRIELADAEVRVGQSLLPVHRLDVDATASQRLVRFEYEIEIMQGRGHGDGAIGLDDQFSMDLNWTVADAQFASLIDHFTREPTKHAARLQSEGSLSADLRDWPESVDGSAVVTADQGRFVELPLLSELIRMVRGAIPRLPVLDSILRPDISDRGAMNFAIRPDHLDISRFELIAAFVAARGVGKLFYDGQLDLTVSAGPMQKVESMLGPLGDLIGRFTDQLLVYDVQGTVSNPVYRPRPLGMGGR